MFGFTSFSEAPFSSDGVQYATASVTGVLTGTQLGTIGTSGDAVILEEGVTGTGAIGTVSIAVDISVTGQSATGDTGTPLITGDANVLTAGVLAGGMSVP